MGTTRKDWVYYLDDALWAYQIVFKGSIGSLPMYLSMEDMPLTSIIGAQNSLGDEEAQPEFGSSGRSKKNLAARIRRTKVVHI